MHSRDLLGIPGFFAALQLALERLEIIIPSAQQSLYLAATATLIRDHLVGAELAVFVSVVGRARRRHVTAQIFGAALHGLRALGHEGATFVRAPVTRNLKRKRIIQRCTHFSERILLSGQGTWL